MACAHAEVSGHTRPLAADTRSVAAHSQALAPQPSPLAAEPSRWRPSLGHRRPNLEYRRPTLGHWRPHVPHWRPTMTAGFVGRALAAVRTDDAASRLRRFVAERLEKFPPRHLAAAAAVPLVITLAIFIFERGFSVGTSIRQRPSSAPTAMSTSPLPDVAPEPIMPAPRPTAPALPGRPIPPRHRRCGLSRSRRKPCPSPRRPRPRRSRRRPRRGISSPRVSSMSARPLRLRSRFRQEPLLRRCPKPSEKTLRKRAARGLTSPR